MKVFIISAIFVIAMVWFGSAFCFMFSCDSDGDVGLLNILGAAMIALPFLIYENSHSSYQNK